MQETLGPGRILIAVYAVFAVSASARSVYQLVLEFEQAPIAYSLSFVAALVYVLATLFLAKPRLRRYAKYAIGFEAIGVLAVGALSLLTPDWFNHPSVWSGFGIGYGFVPLILPLVGFVWLRKINA
ncbi:MAG: hypothetical protein F2536_03765 [Actinobacteria bacterium]|uniref:Unannotated protein n=1 Tax=freshwater metagenome TaxID=449393 RepID=A0A6J6E4R5_9ZZZZ|nr:hypothetical protein [Actinomycetota bacterium]MTA90018.1 hypothetical protein [Actinomycetota bacterium]